VRSSEHGLYLEFVASSSHFYIQIPLPTHSFPVGSYHERFVLEQAFIIMLKLREVEGGVLLSAYEALLCLLASFTKHVVGRRTFQRHGLLLSAPGLLSVEVCGASIYE